MGDQNVEALPLLREADVSSEDGVTVRLPLMKVEWLPLEGTKHTMFSIRLSENTELPWSPELAFNNPAYIGLSPRALGLKYVQAYLNAILSGYTFLVKDVTEEGIIADVYAPVEFPGT